MSRRPCRLFTSVLPVVILAGAFAGPAGVWARPYRPMPQGPLHGHAKRPHSGLHFRWQYRHLSDLYGLGTYIAQRYPDEIGPSMYRIRRTGVHWVREEFTASDLHHHPNGPLHFAVYDRVIDHELHNHLHVLGLLDYNNTFDGLDHTYMPHADIVQFAADFVRYAVAVVEHYKNKISDWQIWNEPDLSEFWKPHPSAPDYAYLLKQLYPAIKQVQPNAKILLGGPSGRDPHPFRFLWRVVRAHAPFDILTIQPYADLPDMRLADQIQRLRKFHEPIWFTEIGWAGQVGCEPCGDAVYQARRLATMYLISAVEGIQRVFWYDFRDDGLGLSFPDHFGLVEWNFKGKAAYRAFEVSLALLDRANLLGWTSVGSGIRLYRFKTYRTHRLFFVAWNTTDSEATTTVRWPKRHQVLHILDDTGSSLGWRRGLYLHLWMQPVSVEYLLASRVRIPGFDPQGLKIAPGHTRAVP